MRIQVNAYDCRFACIQVCSVCVCMCACVCVCAVCACQAHWPLVVSSLQLVVEVTTFPCILTISQ